MAKGAYLPKSDAELVSWHDRFKIAATAIGATLGIVAEDLLRDQGPRVIVEAMDRGVALAIVTVCMPLPARQ
jgi:hypothetical protein